jgi:hypothetical protein
MGIEFSNMYSPVTGSGQGEWRLIITATYYTVKKINSLTYIVPYS